MEMLHEGEFEGMRACRYSGALKASLQDAELNRRVPQILERHGYQANHCRPGRPRSLASFVGAHRRPPTSAIICALTYSIPPFIKRCAAKKVQPLKADHPKLSPKLSIE